MKKFVGFALCLCVYQLPLNVSGADFVPQFPLPPAAKPSFFRTFEQKVQVTRQAFLFESQEEFMKRSAGLAAHVWSAVKERTYEYNGAIFALAEYHERFRDETLLPTQRILQSQFNEYARRRTMKLALRSSDEALGGFLLLGIIGAAAGAALGPVVLSAAAAELIGVAVGTTLLAPVGAAGAGYLAYIREKKDLFAVWAVNPKIILLPTPRSELKNWRFMHLSR